MSSIEILIQNVDAIILLFVESSFGALSAMMGIFWKMMFILFIALYGYKVLYSAQFKANLLSLQILKAVLILVIVTSWDHFFLLIYALATDLPSDIAGVLIQNASNALGQNMSDASSANRALSLYYDRSFEITEKIMEGASWSDWSPYIYASAVSTVSLIFSSYGAMLIILSKLAVGILLAVGPIFILLLMFEPTKSLFEGWLRTLLNYALIPIFIYAIIGFFLILAENPLSYLEDNSEQMAPLLTAIAPFLLISVVAIMVMAQVMNIAASITGGLSLSTMGVAAWSTRAAIHSPRTAKTLGITSYKTFKGGHYLGSKGIELSKTSIQKIANLIGKRKDVKL
tara:strand:- start:2159 stop:3184 length:1026 start_codon:yes stop_codon:yes gene_type:complete